MPTEETPAADPEATAASAEIVADELADVALDDPERAAQFVAAVTPASARAAPSKADAGFGSVPVAVASVAERAMPAAIVGVFLLQVLPKGRLKRLGLAVLGSALVAGLVAGKQQQQTR